MRLRTAAVPDRGDRPRNLRLAPLMAGTLICLIALWLFAAWGMGREGFDLYQANERDTTAGRPTKSLINALQEERRASLVDLGNRKRRGSTPGLQRQRARTDQTISQWRKSAYSAPGDKVQRFVRATSKQLEALRPTRAAIDRGSITRSEAAQTFASIIDEGLLITAANAELDDVEISADGRALIALTRAREQLSREDALLAGVLAEGRFESGENLEFGQAISLRQNAETQALAELPQPDRTRVEGIRRGADYTALGQIEAQVLQPQPQRRPGQPPSPRLQVSAADWGRTNEKLLTKMDEAIDLGGDAVVERSKPKAMMFFFRLAVVGVLGAFAIGAAIVVSVRTLRLLNRHLGRLLSEVRDTGEKTPDIIARLSRGENLDVDALLPPLRLGTDVIGQIADRFNGMRQVSIKAAVDQAMMREQNRRILLHLGRRTGSMILQQIALITDMERRQDLDQEAITKLFRLDHRTVQGRRFVQNMIFLAGGNTTTISRIDMSLHDVIRAAASQVEGYERVQYGRMNEEMVRGFATENVASILAELLDNALSYSPSKLPVDVETDINSTGIAVIIHDRGRGIAEEELNRINAFLTKDPDFLSERSNEGQIGFFVVAKRAGSHGIRVTLKTSPYGGLSAVVVLPHDILNEPAPQLARAGAAQITSPQAAALPTPTASERPSAPTLVALHGERTSSAPTAARASEPEHQQVSLPSHTQADAPSPAGDGPEPSEGSDPDGTTPGGLPVRRPQANLAPELRTEAPPLDDEAELPASSPEQTLDRYRNYQRGTEKGRANASGDDEPAGGTGEDSSRDETGE
ncbi:sensor histidine kinase [Spirillospora sp. CA-108201]